MREGEGRGERIYLNRLCTVHVRTCMFTTLDLLSYSLLISNVILVDRCILYLNAYYQCTHEWGL